MTAADQRSATAATRGRTPTGRLPTQLREIELTTGYVPHAEGSALLHWGGTTVLATVTIEAKLPPHLRSSGHKGGWLTAEYALLPRSTNERTPRERLYSGGRTQEIQRLIGRALRSTLDLDMFKGKTITVDVDVRVADGGTRCAGIVAGYAALHQAADKLVYKGDLAEWPLRHEVGAVSVGLRGDEVLLRQCPLRGRGAQGDVAVADVVLVPHAHPHAAAAREHDDAVDDLPGLAAVTTGVHRERPAQGPGDAGQEFRPSQVMRAGEARHLGAGHTGLRI